MEIVLLSAIAAAGFVAVEHLHQIRPPAIHGSGRCSMRIPSLTPVAVQPVLRLPAPAEGEPVPDLGGPALGSDHRYTTIDLKGETMTITNNGSFQVDTAG